MLISEAQRKTRAVYLGGSVGQLVSDLVRFASAALAAFANPRAGFRAPAVGGAAVFPLTPALMHLASRPGECA